MLYKILLSFVSVNTNNCISISHADKLYFRGNLYKLDIFRAKLNNNNNNNKNFCDLQVASSFLMLENFFMHTVTDMWNSLSNYVFVCTRLLLTVLLNI